MAITTLKLWMAPESNRLLSGPSSFSPAQNPVFYEGNTARIELHILAGAGVGKVPYEVAFPAGASIKLAVGQVNAFPTSGTWQLMVDDVETADMPFNATPAQVQASLNALATVQAAGGVTSALNGDGYTVTWNTYGTKPDIGIGSDTLVPSSYESISLVQQGTADNRKVIYIELRQAPVALGVEWDPLPTPVMTVEEVTAWNGTTKTWRFNIEPAPKAGSYNLTVAGASTKSYTLSYAATADNITTAISKDFAGAKAYKTGETQFDIVFNEDVTLTADGNGLIGYLGYIGNVNFSTAEIHQFIGGLASRQTTLEVAIEAGGIPQTLIQVNCVVSSDVISNGVLQPLPLGTAMSEQVANARFVRRDINQYPDGGTQNEIWRNIGLVNKDGTDVVAALSYSSSPSFANPFVTLSDISGLGSTWGNITGTLSDQTDLQSALDSKYDASNPSGFIQDASATAFTYGRQMGQWEAVLPLTGGALNANASLTASDTSTLTDSELAGWGLGVQLSADHTKGTTVEFDGLDVYNGASHMNVNPTGLTFPDATVQTTAAISFDPAGYATESWVTSQGYTTEGWVNSQGFLTSGAISDMATMSWVTGQGYATESFVTSQGYLAFDTYNRLTFAGGTNPDPSPLPGRFWFQSEKFRYSTSVSSLGNVIASESWVQGLGYAQLSGATFTGKVNFTSVGGAAGLNVGIGGTNTTATTAGDMWIATGGASLNYRDGLGTWRVLPNTGSINTFTQPQIIATTLTSTTPALRITNIATAAAAHSLLVEDDANPDSTSFIITNSGNVGIGLATGYTATQKVEVVGNVKADAFINGTGPTYNVKAIQAHSGGSDTHELLVSVNGSTYRVGMKFVSTP